MSLLVLDDHYNPRLVKDLLKDLSMTLHGLTIHAGRCVLVGNINTWLCRLEIIHKWKQQVNNLQIPNVGGVLVFVWLYVCMCVAHPKTCFSMLWASTHLQVQFELPECKCDF